jgi:hypothetical protein
LDVVEAPMDPVSMLPWWMGFRLEPPRLVRQAMTKRTARRGAFAGRAFRGCTGYPACRGTRALG